ncbi:UDP-glycosyltransferase 83A1-like [Pistacia vera]|uniref:UDP-glycosyltransferase 83A1-like n=1 Tax=Pistacia vera TaxID=55513 RepID=UPI00126352F3|nr:UDP-glycosyltransferase 83A1-like [Pistacia vera]
MPGKLKTHTRSTTKRKIKRSLVIADMHELRRETYDSAGAKHSYNQQCKSYLERWRLNHPEKIFLLIEKARSFTVLDKIQFQELALGLELPTDHSYGCEADITDDANEAYPRLYERVANRGKMVGWAPQQKVLSHPSIACFISHCGWNSTMEGFNNDESGIITEKKLRQGGSSAGDENFKAKALELQESALKSVKEGGLSNQTFKKFIEWIEHRNWNKITSINGSFLLEQINLSLLCCMN